MQAAAYLQHFFKIGKLEKTKNSTDANETDLILAEIAKVTSELDNVKRRFDFEIEDDMIEACIFQERALLSRYSYLLSLAKQKGLYQSPTNRLLLSRQTSN